LQAQQDLRCGVERKRAGLQPQHPELELLDGRVQPLTAHERLGGPQWWRDRREVGDLQQLFDVDVLGVRPARSTLSEAAMISTPNPEV
jgi:hypothetical protein